MSAAALRLLALLLCLAPGPAAMAADPHSASVDVLYRLDCGTLRTTDLSANWTPGAHVGESFSFSNNCYLIRHGAQWFLWETGIDDQVADRPDGVSASSGLLTLSVRVRLADQLKALGLSPDDVDAAAVSHFHPDHVGNARLFAHHTIFYVQRREYDAARASDAAERGVQDTLLAAVPASHVRLIDGDYDVFGDGSVVLLSTPGHTPGHQSLQVRLPVSGVVLLSGDAAHLAENFGLRRVPIRNWSAEATRASMARLAMIMKRDHATLWINHDQDESAQLPLAPAIIR